MTCMVADRFAPADRLRLLETGAECDIVRPDTLDGTARSKQTRPLVGRALGGIRDGRFVFGLVYVLLALLTVLIPVKVWGQEQSDACMASRPDIAGHANDRDIICIVPTPVEVPD